MGSTESESEFLYELDLQGVIAKVIFDICEENILSDLQPKYKKTVFDCPYCGSDHSAELTNINRNDYISNRKSYNSKGIYDYSDYACLGKYLWEVHCEKNPGFHMSTGDLHFPDEYYYEYENNPLLKLAHEYMRYCEGDMNYEEFVNEYINKIPQVR